MNRVHAWGGAVRVERAAGWARAAVGRSLTENLGHAYVNVLISGICSQRKPYDILIRVCAGADPAPWRCASSATAGGRLVLLGSRGRLSGSPRTLIRSACAFCWTYTLRHTISCSGIAAGELCGVHTAWSAA